MSTDKKYSLPREFAEKWVRALRSGEYKQDSKRGLLKSRTGYCCLGVACKMVGVKSFKNAQWITLETYGLPKVPNGIPIEIHGYATVNPLVKELSSMNDKGKTFPQIADWIESNCQFTETPKS